jgi:hypothetical protein
MYKKVINFKNTIKFNFFIIFLSNSFNINNGFDADTTIIVDNSLNVPTDGQTGFVSSATINLDNIIEFHNNTITDLFFTAVFVV